MKIWILFLNILLLNITIFSEISIEINTPQLNDGMERLEAILTTYIGHAVSDLETTVEDTLSKPKLIGAFATSSTLSQTSSMVSTRDLIGNYYFSMGLSAGLYSEVWELQEIESIIDNLTPEDDYEIGANVQLLNLSLAHPWVSLHFSYIDLKKNNFFYDSISGGISSSYSPLKKYPLGENWAITPLSIGGGLSYSQSSVGVSVEAGIIGESFDIDPDGNGPLTSQSIEVEMDPVIDVGIITRTGVVNLSLSSTLFLRHIFSFSLGGGVYKSFGEGSASVYSSTDIEVLGYLNGLIESPGSITISGEISSRSPEEFIGYIYTGGRAYFSLVSIGFNALFSPDKGVCLSLTTGISL